MVDPDRHAKWVTWESDKEAEQTTKKWNAERESRASANIVLAELSHTKVTQLHILAWLKMEGERKIGNHSKKKKTEPK